MTSDPGTDIDGGDLISTPSPARGNPRGRTRRNAATDARSLPRGQALGRNGETITRTVTTEGDEFHIPDHLKEPGWDYQWLPESVMNDTGIVRQNNHTMYRAGWRPVLATGRWNGVFGPKQDTGHVVVRANGLYERPLALSEEAKAEEKQKAITLIRDRDQALMRGVKGMLPEGFEASRAAMNYKGRTTSRQMAIDYDANPLAQEYQPADDDVA